MYKATYRDLIIPYITSLGSHLVRATFSGSWLLQKSHLGHSPLDAIWATPTMQLRIPVWWAIFDQLHHRFLGLGKCRKFMHQPIHRFNNKIWRFCTKHVIMWPFFVFRYVASLSFNATIIMEGNIEMKHFLGVIWILQKHPRKDPHPPAAANPLKTNEFQAAEPNLKAWLVSGSRASVLTQALSNLTILPAVSNFQRWVQLVFRWRFRDRIIYDLYWVSIPIFLDSTIFYIKPPNQGFQHCSTSQFMTTVTPSPNFMQYDSCDIVRNLPCIFCVSSFIPSPPKKWEV